MFPTVRWPAGAPRRGLPGHRRDWTAVCSPSGVVKAQDSPNYSSQARSIRKYEFWVCMGAQTIAGVLPWYYIFLIPVFEYFLPGTINSDGGEWSGASRDCKDCRGWRHYVPWRCIHLFGGCNIRTLRSPAIKYLIYQHCVRRWIDYNGMSSGKFRLTKHLIHWQLFHRFHQIAQECGGEARVGRSREKNNNAQSSNKCSEDFCFLSFSLSPSNSSGVKYRIVLFRTFSTLHQQQPPLRCNRPWLDQPLSSLKGLINAQALVYIKKRRKERKNWWEGQEISRTVAKTV